MLVLSRRLNEKILVPNVPLTIQVVAIKSGVVRLGIEAPRDVTVLREELPYRAAEWVDAAEPNEIPAGAAPPQHLNQVVRKRLQIADVGLAVLRGQLQTGQTEDAAETLTKLREDLHLLQQRLEREADPTPPCPVAKGAPSPRALLVEDNANERELLATFLRLAGVAVDTVNDGCDALDYLHTHGRPDVVLLDMGLPRCDGATMVRAIRRDAVGNGLKIFAVTGHAREEFTLDSGPAGIDRWFHRPIDLTALVAVLNDELRVCHP